MRGLNISPSGVQQVLLLDFLRFRPQALCLRLEEVAPFLLEAMDQAEVYRVLDRFAVAKVIHLLVWLLGREPARARERLPAV